MSLIELLIVAVGLSMDAFAVALCKGLSLKKTDLKTSCVVGLWFGGFQALMPLLGYFLGTYFTDYIASFAHLISFILLAAIGANMIRESFSNDSCESGASGGDLGLKNMFVMAIATSIDALAAGVTFAFLEVRILPAVIFIGLITFILSAVGVKAGGAFGMKYKSKSEFAGGAILILLGIKILLEHFGIT